MSHINSLAYLVLAAAATAAPAAAATLPTGAWACHVGPSWDQFTAEPAATPARMGATRAQIWIFDQSHYASSSEDDRGRFALEGDSLVASSGPFTRVPMTARYSTHGIEGRPTIFLHWSTAPQLFLDCLQS